MTPEIRAVWLVLVLSMLVACLVLRDTSPPRTVDPMVTLAGWYDGIYSTRMATAHDLTE
jgi:hypothetical protein